MHLEILSSIMEEDIILYMKIVVKIYYYHITQNLKEKIFGIIKMQKVLI